MILAERSMVQNLTFNDQIVVTFDLNSVLYKVKEIPLR